MTATILVADRATLERLVLEGGLRSSFIAVFGGTLFDTADDTPRGDGVGLDDLLEDRRVVCMDDALLAPVDPAAPDRAERERYRHNLVRKLATRQLAWLTVVENGGEAQAASVRALAARIREVAGGAGKDGQVRRATAILVFTHELQDDTKQEIRRIRDEVPGIARVFVMAHRLQPAERGQRAITAHAVWPVCVARLIAARSALQEGEPVAAEIRVWRSIEWGVGRSSQWIPLYRGMLRERLFPSQDAEGREVMDGLDRVFGTGEGTVDAAPPKQGIREFAWELPAEDISAAGFASVHDSVFERLLRASGIRSLAGRALQVGIDRDDLVEQKVREHWKNVADRDRGLTDLRRLADGRGWPQPDAKAAHERQRRGWADVIAKRRELDEARENHRDATEELAIARSRHLSLLWRLVIAAVVMLFLGQFLASILLPLRPDGEPIIPPASESREYRFMGKALACEDSVVFLVDCSFSMDGERIEALRSELENALAPDTGLRDGVEFDIVSFTHETTDDMTFSGAERKLVKLDPDVRKSAQDWVRRRIVANGLTNPSFGLERILAMDPLPARIVLMTDGEFLDRQAVRRAIEQFEGDHPGQKAPAIETIALWWRGEEPFLRAISERTGGEYRFEGFNLFEPHGFTKVATVILSATALGVAIGTFVPFWLEVVRGRRAVFALRTSLLGLLREFCHVTVDTQVLLRGAAEARITRSVNAASSHQRSFAARALGAIDRAFSVAQDRLPQSVAGSSARAVGSLVGEDRRDLARALDSSIPELAEEVDPAEVEKALATLADEHARDLRRQWSEFCETNDPARTGHLPAWAAERMLRERLGRCCDASALKFLFNRFDVVLAAVDGVDRRRNMADDLCRRVQDDKIPGCLSARMGVKGGRLPHRTIASLWLAPPDGEYPRVAGMIEFVRTELAGKLRHLGALEKTVPDTGLVSLGIIHEEFAVDFPPGGEGSADHDVVAVKEFRS